MHFTVFDQKRHGLIEEAFVNAISVFVLDAVQHLKVESAP
jgi:hypothetical protein